MRTPTESEPKMKPVDGTVGPLVWVRRPNGRWWPGRILCADEVPDNSSVPQKNPVKLFGNDDAKVHWINLETSTRLKSFRCGEFDDWIEKAKASSSRSSKKDSKYARREDAILQALELESGLQERLFDVPVLREENKPAVLGVTPVSRIEQLSLKWQSKGKRRNRDKCLLDVYLEVHAGKSQGREHVPYISLASKTQGRLFTGHPITVEVLEDGACEHMMRNYYASQGAVVRNEVMPDLVDTRPRKKRFTSVSVGKSSKAKKKGKIQNLSHGGDKEHPSSKLSVSDRRHIIPVKVAMNTWLKDLLRAARRDNTI